MVEQGDKVWGVRDDNSVALYKNENDARALFLDLLKYYKNHTKKTHNDHWAYDVWHVTDEDDTHFACIHATCENGVRAERELSISYQEYVIH